MSAISALSSLGLNIKKPSELSIYVFLAEKKYYNVGLLWWLQHSVFEGHDLAPASKYKQTKFDGGYFSTKTICSMT